MNEQYKTTEEIDKVLKQKKELLAQKEANFGLLQNKKEEAKKAKKQKLLNEYNELTKMYEEINKEIDNLKAQELSTQEKNITLSPEIMREMSISVENGIRSLGKGYLNEITGNHKNPQNDETEKSNKEKSKIQNKINDLNNRRFSEIAEIMGDRTHSSDKREKLIKATNETYDLLEEAYKKSIL